MGSQVPGLSDLTERSAVLQAMVEFDELGRDVFLARYGYGPARSYFVVHNGKQTGVAVGKQFPTSGPLAPSDFSGGEATVEAKLESLGFEVERLQSEPPDPPRLPALPIDPDTQAWAEITSLEHGHGGPGWELGRYLWSPTSSRDGADRYSIMNQPAIGDMVFHLVSGLAGEPSKRRFLFGVSRVFPRCSLNEEKAAASWNLG
jgi:hypothetical protein